MKSPQLDGLNLAADERKRYGELKVMRSNAGWYVGSTYRDVAGFEEPGTRDSGYFGREADAEAELRAYEGGEPTARPHP